MSIKEDSREIKPLSRGTEDSEQFHSNLHEPQILEEEFDIISKNGQKHWFSQEKTLLVVIAGLIGFLGYGIWKLESVLTTQKSVQVIYPHQTTETTTSSSAATSTGSTTIPAVLGVAAIAQGITENSQGTNEVVVGSKSGTKYHFPSCSGAKRIAPQNLITFQNFIN